MHSRHMHSPPILLAFALGLVAACDSDRSGTRAPDPDAPAAVVMSIEGTVRARPAQGEARVLAPGDQVTGTDTIETGPDSSVELQLHHNGARWFLGADKRVKVTESLAWSMPEQPRQPLLARTDDIDPTAAAGRQAEREAARTRATARPIAGDEPAAEPAAELPGDRAPVDTSAGTQDSVAKAKPGQRSSSPAGKQSTSRSGAAKRDKGKLELDAARPSARGFVAESAQAETISSEDSQAGGAGAPVGGAGDKANQRPAIQQESQPVAKRAMAPSAQPARLMIKLGATRLGGAGADAGHPGDDAERAVRAAIDERLPDLVKCLGGHRPEDRDLSISFKLTSASRVSDLRGRGKDKVLSDCIDEHLGALRITGVAAGTRVEQALTLTGF